MALCTRRRLLPSEPNPAIFVRDARGKVTHHVLYWPNGQVTVTRRIP
jgi:hypothetical protein